jgi:hypothetical protein
MKTLKYSSLIFVCLITAIAQGQTIKKSYAGTVKNTTCPGIGIQYEIDKTFGCKPIWEITNGQIQSQTCLWWCSSPPNIIMLKTDFSLF